MRERPFNDFCSQPADEGWFDDPILMHEHVKQEQGTVEVKNTK